MPISKEEHIFKRFDQELEHLRSLVLEMGGLVEDQINQAVQALDDEDTTAAREIVSRDHQVNALELKADEKITSILALRQPMGSDLRLIIALAKTVTDLERVGDEAAKIARMAIHIYERHGTAPQSRLLRDVPPMTRLASGMLRNCLDALARMDNDKALIITKGDRELDEAFQDALRRLITYMIEDPRSIGHAINVVFILKALERIGDHAKNVAEYVVYLVKGEDIRHTEPDSAEQEVMNRSP